jgi:hypothetical protein
MMIWTEAGWKQITVGHTNLVKPEPPLVLKKLEIEWILARNYWVREYNKSVAASTDYLIKGEWVKGPMKGIPLLPEVSIPLWCKQENKGEDNAQA